MRDFLNLFGLLKRKVIKMEKVEKALKKEMSLLNIHKSSGFDRALNELLYSARETGLIDFKLDNETAVNIWKLVEIAKEYRTTLPDKLKM